MSPHSIIRTLAAAALIALPSIAMAAPDQNTNNNGCPNGQWRNGNGQCVNNGNGNGNGQWNNNGNGQNNGRHRDRDDRNNRGDRDDRNNRNNNGQYNNGGYNNGQYNNGNGQYNNGGYNNGGYSNGNYGNRGGQLNGQVSSFSPYNLYLSNGTHVVLHNGTVINPTGTNLTSGERVRVIGNWNQDGTFNANEVDVTNNGYGNYRR